MFSNLQSDDQSLIQIMLVGQPELKDRLLQPGHSPFAQRIAVNFFLSGLADNKTKSYIAYRLEKADGRPDIFSQDAIDMIFKASGGIPRSINLICDIAMVYGFGYELETIDAPVIEQVVKDKGGMGINAETENKAEASLSSIEQEIDKAAMVRLQKLEDTIQLMQNQYDSMIDVMEDLQERSNTFKKDTDRKLERLLLLERKRNDKLLVAYSQLKVKYHNLLNAWKNKLK